MSPAGKKLLVEIFERHEKDLLNAWMDLQLRSATSRRDLIKDNELREQSAQFLRLLRDATARAGTESIDNAAWAPVRELLASISSSRARQGFTPSETATFVFSLKQPLFARLRQELGSDARRPGR